MSKHMQDGMAEATRLTREGRLTEATAAIQRALGGGFAPASSKEDHGETIETTLRDVDETPHTRPASTHQEGPAKYDLRRAPGTPRPHRNTPRSPGGGSSATFAKKNAPGIVPASGRFLERSYAGQAGGRGYKLYIPSGYTGQAVALIVILHGCTQSPEDFAAGTRMNQLDEEHTFLVAYPAQDPGANNSRCWNWFKTSDQQRGAGEPSIIAGITREILDEYEVAEGRVYVAGMSAGGAMAGVMAATYPDLYAAVGVHSGLAPGAARDLPSAFSAMQNGGPATTRRDSGSRTTPMIVFHGDRDRTVHPSNADRLLAHCQIAGSGESAHTDPSPGGHSYTRVTYRNADGRAVAERWTVHGLGHAWSGGSRSGSYTDPRGPDASAEMVRFFDQH